MFTKTGSFHWCPRRFIEVDYTADQTTQDVKAEQEVDQAVQLLNRLTPAQQKAVELYGRSRYEEGYDEGAEND